MSAGRATPKTASVIGGGIVGLCSALGLRERGLAVTLYDAPRDMPPASWGNAGHIALEQVAPLASWRAIAGLPRRLAILGGPVGLPPGALGEWLPFGLRLMRAASPARFAAGTEAMAGLMRKALPAWRRLAGKLGDPGLLRETGHIVAWESAASARTGRRACGRMASDLVTIRDLAGAEMACLEAGLARVPVDAIRFTGTASVADPAGVLAALRRQAMDAGISFLPRSATIADAATEGDLVVVAAGARSGELVRALGLRVPLIAERGYHIQAPAPRWPEALPPVVFEDRSMVVTGFASGLRATSVTEFTRDEAPAVTAHWRRLERHARAIGLPFETAPTRWLGSRPTLPDYLPVIGRCPGHSRVLLAFGHQHLGLTLGPVTGEIIATVAADEAPPVGITAFSAARFSSR